MVQWLAALPVVRSSPHPTFVAAILIGSPPLLAVLAGWIEGGSVSWFIWGTAITYGVLSAVMVLAAVTVWQQVIDLTPDLDAMLEEVDQVAIATWLSRTLRSMPQVLSLLLGIAASTWVGIKLSGPLGSYSDHGGLAYSVAIGWTGGIGALTVYWLWGTPALYYPLTRIERPNVDWIAPLQTPAVQRASRLSVSTSRWSTLGLLLFMAPIAATVILASPELSVWILSIFPVIFACITVLACSVIPQIVLQDLLRRGKRQTLSVISEFLPGPREAFADPHPQQLQAIELYRAIADSSVSTLDWKRFIEYLLLFFGALVPVAIALIDSLGSSGP